MENAKFELNKGFSTPKTSPMPLSSPTFPENFVSEKVFFESESHSDYLGHDAEGRNVLLKIYSEAISDGIKFTENIAEKNAFLDEINIDGIAKIYDYGKNKDDRLYVMRECVDGIGMNELLTLRLPVCTVFAILMSACQTLSSLHASGFLHRNLSPSNFIVRFTPEGIQVTLTDVSLCSYPGFSVYEDDVYSDLIVDWAYRAPELTSFRIESLGSEIYSLGTILFQLLSGNVPFLAASPDEIMARHNKEPVPVLCLKSKSSGDAINALLQKSMHKVIWSRHYCAAELEKALSEIQVSDESLPRAEICAIQLRSPRFVNSAQNQNMQPYTDWCENSQNPTMVSVAFNELKHIPSTNRKTDFPKKDFNETPGTSSQTGTPGRSLLLSEKLPLYARDTEVAAVRGAVDGALRGNPSIFMISGPAGIGKNAVIESALKSYLRSDYVQVFKILLEEEFNESRRNDESFVKLFNEILGCSNVESNALKDYFAFKYKDLRLSEFMTGDAFLSFLRPSQGSKILLSPEKLTELLLNSVFESTYVVIIEQLHFANTHFLRFMELLAAELSVSSRRLLVIATYEERELPVNTKLKRFFRSFAKHEGNCVTTLRMNLLPDDMMLQFVTENLEVDGQLAILLKNAAGGNPRIAIQMLQKNISEHIVSKNADGLYSVNDGCAWNAEYPEALLTVQKKFVAKAKNYFDKNIDEETYDLILQRLAVLGNEFEDEIIDLFFEKEGDENLLAHLDNVLETLLNVGLLKECRISGKIGLAFESPSLRESVLNTYSLRKLRPIHKLAAQVKGEFYKNMSLSRCEEMAVHFERIMDRNKALAMKYNAFLKAVSGLNILKVLALGSDLLSAVETQFIKESGKTLDDLFKPIDYSKVLYSLVTSYTVLDMTEGATRICDSLYYLADKFSSPLLRKKADLASFLRTIASDSFEKSYDTVSSLTAYFKQAEVYDDLIRAHYYTILLLLKYDRYNELPHHISVLRHYLADIDSVSKNIFETFTNMAHAYICAKSGQFSDALRHIDNTRVILDLVQLKELSNIIRNFELICKVHLGQQSVKSLNRDAMTQLSGKFIFEHTSSYIIFQLALIYQFHTKFEDLNIVLQRMQQFALKINARHVLARIELRYAYMHYAAGDYDKCVEKLNTGMKQMIELKNITLVNESLIAYASCSLIARDYNRCERCLMMVQQLYPLSKQPEVLIRADAINKCSLILQNDDESVFDFIDECIKTQEETNSILYSEYYIIPGMEKAAKFHRLDLILRYFEAGELLNRHMIRISATQFFKSLETIIDYVDSCGVSHKAEYIALSQGLNAIRKMVTETCYEMKKNIASLSSPSSPDFSYIDQHLSTLPALLR